MHLSASLQDMVEVELTSADPESTLRYLNSLGMELLHVTQSDDLAYRFFIRRTAYPKLYKIAEKKGESVRLIRNSRLFLWTSAVKKRIVLLIGILMLLIAAIWIPSRVFFVRIEGNSIVADRRILAAAEECGIRFGSSRAVVRSERVKNALLDSVPELQWAGVNTAGCVATISVRERIQGEDIQRENQVSSMIAGMDGYILSATATQGSLMVQPGETVSSGQILISGYTDCGICIQATASQGEIMAQTNRVLQVITPTQWNIKGNTERKKRKISLRLGKKRINLWKDSGILGDSCGRMYEEYYITLPGGFSLPAALCVETYLWNTMEPCRSEQPELQTEMMAFSQAYLREQMVSGNITGMETSFSEQNGTLRLKADYICTEMIGRIRQEEIGDINGKNS